MIQPTIVGAPRGQANLSLQLLAFLLLFAHVTPVPECEALLAMAVISSITNTNGIPKCPEGVKPVWNAWKSAPGLKGKESSPVVNPAENTYAD